MEPAAFVSYLKADGPGLLAAGKRAPSARVPSCPEWDAQALVGHLGSAYWWVEAMVRERATDMVEFSETPAQWDALCGWYEEGMAALILVLEEVGDDEPVWNWQAMGAGPARFWHRRIAHETSVHRWDIERAVGTTHVIDAPLALDGIEEYLGIVPVWVALSPRPGLSGSLGLVATDTDAAYTLSLAPDVVEYHEGLRSPDAVVRASASDLLLWLLGRRTTESEQIGVEGDPSVPRAWAEIKFG
jgi:uncharacterized protein (TIGR03083 family)